MTERDPAQRTTTGVGTAIGSPIGAGVDLGIGLLGNLAGHTVGPKLLAKMSWPLGKPWIQPFEKVKSLPAAEFVHTSSRLAKD